MTDDEIVGGLESCDALIQSYVAKAQPIASELARRMSIAVCGKEGIFEGDLGCWDVGVTVLCLHYRGVGRLSDEEKRKADAFIEEWNNRILLKHISIDTFTMNDV